MNPHLPLRIATGFGLGLSLLILALWLSWQALVPVDFGYGLAYRLMDIEQHVQRFGPQNRYKDDFERTSPDEQKRLFGAIVTAIQHDGDGLRTIFYTTDEGRRHTLLREAEAIHLQDVANLIDLFDKAALVSALLLAGIAGFLKVRQFPAPSILHMLGGLGVLLLVCGLILLIAGPTHTFYWLHTQIFPDEHEWFFYYQDSLMTTLMKAPDLFGFIAVLWVTLAVLVLAAGYWLLVRWLAGSRRMRPEQTAFGRKNRKIQG